MTLGRWERVGEEDRHDYGIFSLRTWKSRSPRTGQARRFTVVDTADWVNVVAVTPEGRFVLVRQYRHGIDEFTLEIPGGVIDPGESPEEAAVRELREETGHVGAAPIRIGVVAPNPAIQTNACYTCVITECRRVGDPEPDPGEDLAVETLSAGEIRAAVRDGGITHALVLCAFAWYREHAADDLPRL